METLQRVLLKTYWKPIIMQTSSRPPLLVYFINILQNKEPGIRRIFSPYFHLICFFPCVRLYLLVGKLQISQADMVRLSHPTASCPRPTFCK